MNIVAEVWFAALILVFNWSWAVGMKSVVTDDPHISDGLSGSCD